MRRDLLVYLAGPLSPVNGRTAEDHLTSAASMHLFLLNLGVPNFCPHLAGFYGPAWTQVKYETMLDFDLHMLERSTHVLMLEHWEESKGATIEHDRAGQLGLPIYYEVGGLIAMVIGRDETERVRISVATAQAGIEGS